MLKDELLSYRYDTATSANRTVNFVVGGKIYYPIRPESPLKQRNVRIRDVRDYVFLDNFGKHSIEKVRFIQRYYRVQRFALPAFKLIYSFRRKRFGNFVYLYALCHAYNVLRRRHNNAIIKRCIEYICKLAKRKYKIKQAEYSMYLAIQRKVFRRMLLLYYHYARLLKLAKYYYKKYCRRLKAWVFTFLRFKLNFISNLRVWDECDDLYQVYVVSASYFNTNFYIEFHGIFVAKKAVYIEDLRATVQQETLLRPSFIMWLNILRFKRVSFKVSVYLHAQLLRGVIDRWYNESSGRHALLRVCYAKWRIFMQNTNYNRITAKADAFNRRYKLALSFTKLKLNRAIFYDTRIITSVFATYKSGFFEFFVRTMRYLHEKRIVFVGATTQKVDFCSFTEHGYQLRQDFDILEYKKQSYNRTLFSSYDDEFCIKYKMFGCFKANLLARKAFLRLIMISHAMCNISRVHTAILCWKLVIEMRKKGIDAKYAIGNEYAVFSELYRQFYKRSELLEALSIFSHVGISFAAMRQASNGCFPALRSVMETIYLMSYRQLIHTIETKIFAYKECKSEIRLVFKVLWKQTYYKFGAKADATAIYNIYYANSSDWTIMSRLSNLKSIIMRCSPAYFSQFLLRLRKYFGVSSPDLLSCITVARNYKSDRIFTNQHNTVTFAYFLRAKSRKLYTRHAFFDRVLMISPISGFQARFQCGSDILESKYLEEQAVFEPKHQRQQLYEQSIQNAPTKHSSLFFMYQPAVLHLIEQQSKVELDNSFTATLLARKQIYNLTTNSFRPNERDLYRNKRTGIPLIAYGVYSKIQYKSVSRLAHLGQLYKSMSQVIVDTAAGIVSYTRGYSASNLWAAVSQFEYLAREFPLQPADVYLYGFGIPYLAYRISKTSEYRKWDFTEFEQLRTTMQSKSLDSGLRVVYTVEANKTAHHQRDYYALDGVTAANQAFESLAARDTTVFRGYGYKATAAVQMIDSNSDSKDTAIEDLDDGYVGAAEIRVGRKANKNRQTKKVQINVTKSKRGAGVTVLYAATGRGKTPTVAARLPLPSFARSGSKESLVLAKEAKVKCAASKKEDFNSQLQHHKTAITKVFPRNALHYRDTASVSGFSEKLERKTSNVLSSIVLPERMLAAQNAKPFVSTLFPYQQYANQVTFAQIDGMASNSCTFYQAGAYKARQLKAINFPFDDIEIEQIESSFETASQRCYEPCSGDASSDYSSVENSSISLHYTYFAYPRSHRDCNAKSGSDAITQDGDGVFMTYVKGYCRREYQSDRNSLVDLDTVEQQHDFFQELSDRFRNKLLKSPGFVEFAKQNIQKISQYYDQKLTFKANDYFTAMAVLDADYLYQEKISKQKLVGILAHYNEKKVTLQEYFEQRYVDTLIKERCELQRGYRKLSFMYTESSAKPGAASDAKQQQVELERQKSAKMYATAELHAQSRISSAMKQREIQRETRELRKTKIAYENSKKIEIIYLMFKRRTKTTIGELVATPARLFVHDYRDPGRLTTSVVGMTASPYGYKKSMQVAYPTRQIRFESRRNCDNFIFELAKLRTPQLFQLFKYYKWKKHIFTPVVFSQLVDENKTSKKASVLSNKFQRYTFTYMLRSFVNVDFSREMPTTMVTRYVNDHFQYEELTLGYEMPYQPINIDSILELTAKRQWCYKRCCGRPKTQPGTEIAQRIDYGYFNCRNVRYISKSGK